MKLLIRWIQALVVLAWLVAGFALGVCGVMLWRHHLGNAGWVALVAVGAAALALYWQRVLLPKVTKLRQPK